MATKHSERGLDRLVNFSDATVAIAITILILPLVDIAAEISRMPLGQLLAEKSGLLIAFAVSFAVIGQYWYLHHQMFEKVADYNAALIWVNLLWLASIVFLPFAANLLAYLEHPQPAVYALYISTILVTAAAGVGIELVLRSDPHLVVDGNVANVDVIGGTVACVLLAIALVIAVTVPAINMWALLLLVISGPTAGLVRRWGARRSNG